MMTLIGSRTRMILWTSAAALLLAFATLAWAQTSGGVISRGQPPALLNNSQLIFPQVRIVRVGNTIMRFDTANGEMFRFVGQASGPNARGNWLRFARPVTQNTSGLLDVQRIRGGTFLVDLNTGQTWLLRNRGNIAHWVEVQSLGN